MHLRWLTLVLSLRITSPYSDFYEEILNIESPSDFWGTGAEEDQQGGDQVEVFYLEGEGVPSPSKPGVVRIDLETFKLDSQIVHDQVRELLSRTFGDSKLPDVSTLTTLVGPEVGVNNSRSAGFCLKINSRVENLRLNKKVERTFLNLSGEVERGQSAQGADGGSEREPRRATQDSQGDQRDSSDGQPSPQAKSEDGQEKREAQQKKLLEIVNKATEVIESARREQNQRSTKVVRGFGANAVFEPAGIYVIDDVSIYVPESLLRFVPVVKTITAYMGGFSWPHIFTALFGAGSSTLPCSAKDLELVLQEFVNRVPFIHDAAQAKIATTRLRREATVSVSCILSQKDKFAEALEVEFLLEELVENYSQALPQVQSSSQTADSQSQGVLLMEMEQIKNSLARIKEEAVFNIERRADHKNSLAFWGAMLNNIGTVANSLWKALVSKDALEKKAQQWKSMKAEDAERDYYWWLAGAAFLQIGTFSAGYSYQEVVWMQRETGRLECRNETILQETLKKSLVSNPRELLRVTGSKPAAERHLKEFYQEMILTNYCVVKEEEGIPLRAAIRQYFDIAAAVLDLQ